MIARKHKVVASITEPKEPKLTEKRYWTIAGFAWMFALYAAFQIFKESAWYWQALVMISTELILITIFSLIWMLIEHKRYDKKWDRWWESIYRF